MSFISESLRLKSATLRSMNSPEMRPMVMRATSASRACAVSSLAVNCFSAAACRA